MIICRARLFVYPGFVSSLQHHILPATCSVSSLNRLQLVFKFYIDVIIQKSDRLPKGLKLPNLYPTILYELRTRVCGIPL